MPAEPTKGLTDTESQRLAELTDWIESGQTLTSAERERYQKLRDKATGKVEEAESRVRPGPGASTAADVGSETAAMTAGNRISEFLNEPVKAPEITVKDPVAEADLKSADPVVEERWQNARLRQAGIIQRGKDALARAKASFTRHFPYLDPKTDGREIDILRRHEGDPLTSKYMASQIIGGITANLTPRKYGVFERIVILKDLVKYGEEFLKESTELPFGYKSIDAIKTDLTRFEAIADRFPDIREALRRRQEFMDTLKYDLVSRRLLPEAVKDYDEYFHHQVLHYMAMKESPLASTGSQDVRTHMKGWQRKRIGSVRDYNTSYIESEFEVISQSIAQMLTQDTLKALERVADIAPTLKEVAAQARKEGRDVDWHSIVPEDHTIWQPVKGNHFYWANSITDKALDSYLSGLKLLTEADIKEVLAMGGPKQEWVIPKRLAKTLDEFGPKKDHPIEKFIGVGMSQWKRWTLFNPMRNLIYQFNNLSGDADICFAADPKIFQKTPEAARELRKFVLQKKAGTEEINNLVRMGVIDSGFSVQELPDLKGQQFFRTLYGQDPSLIQRYWENVLDFNRWREGVLRYGAYQRALDLVQSGKRVYWASRKTELDALYNDAKVPSEQIAAKLARELVGDYGNISAAGQWIRSKMMPFYSWMEINAPRYVRLFKNISSEEGATGRMAAVAGKKVALNAAQLGLRAGMFYLLASLWNKSFFPDEERLLADTSTQFHIILGRDENGAVRSIRLQGALSDALSWFGAENIIKDVEDVARGTASVGDKIKQVAKAPINKVVNASFPIQKTLIESIFQRSTFPDVFNPRPVRDPGGHVAKLFSLGTVYSYLTNKPQRPGTWSPLALVTYTTDPGEAAYYTAKSIVSEYLEDHNKDVPESLPTRRGNALYYYKQAVKYKNEKQAEYWRQRYMDLGGKRQGINDAIKRTHPLQGLSGPARRQFESSLTPAEKEIVERATDWYKKTYQR